MTTPVPAATPLTAGNRRDHYYVIKAFVPSDMGVGDDRIRWYFDHAIRGYHRTFAAETDPIRAMSRCSVGVEKVPLASLSAPAPAEPREGDAFDIDRAVGSMIDAWDLGPNDIDERRERVKASLLLNIAPLLSAPRPARPDAGEAVAWHSEDPVHEAVEAVLLRYDVDMKCWDDADNIRDDLVALVKNAHPPAASAETARIAELEAVLKLARQRLCDAGDYLPTMATIVIIDAALGAPEVQS